MPKTISTLRAEVLSFLPDNSVRAISEQDVRDRLNDIIDWLEDYSLLKNGQTWLQSVRVLADANVNVAAAPAAIDGITLSSGNRVLLTGQTDPIENGIYLFNGTGAALTRPSDFPAGRDASSVTVRINQGTTYADTNYVQTSEVTVGIGGQVWTEDVGGPGSGLQATDIDTLAELNAILLDATLIDTGDSRLSDARTPTAHTHPVAQISDASANGRSLISAADYAAMRLLLSVNRDPAGDLVYGGSGLAVSTTLDQGQYSFVGFPVVAANAPTLATHLANKAYVDSIVQGLSWKTAARVGEFASNIVIASPGAAIDGVTMVGGDRVLLNAQTAGSENGIWVWNGAGTPMTRPADHASGTDPAGHAIVVTEGTNDAAYVQSVDGILIDTGTQVWVFQAAGAVAAGDGLTQSANVFLVKPDVTTGGDIAPVTVSGNGTGLDVTALDGDHLTVDFTPNNYTPDATPAEADDVDDLAAHLAGINTKLVDVGEILRWQGPWSSPGPYAVRDLVRHENALYVANDAVTVEVPGVSGKWDLLVEGTEGGTVLELVTITNGEGDLTLGTPLGAVFAIVDGGVTGRSPDHFTLSAGTHIDVVNKTLQNQAIADGDHIFVYQVSNQPGLTLPVAREPKNYATADGTVFAGDTVNVATIASTHTGTVFTISGTRRSITVRNEKISAAVTVESVPVGGNETVLLINNGGGWFNAHVF